MTNTTSTTQDTVAAKLQTAIDSGTNPHISAATVWQGNDGRVRVYWGGDSYVEIHNGEITVSADSYKKRERMLKVVKAVLA